MARKNYNYRKLQILRLAKSSKIGISPKTVCLVYPMSPDLSRWLLYHYRLQGLLRHPKRGVYKITKRGEKRLLWLEERIDVGRTLGIEIGLNHHHDRKLQTPIYQIMAEYHKIKAEGSLSPGSSSPSFSPGR